MLCAVAIRSDAVPDGRACHGGRSGRNTHPRHGTQGIQPVKTRADWHGCRDLTNRGGSLGSGLSGLPVAGEEFVEAVHGMGAEAGEDVAGAGEGGKGAEYVTSVNLGLTSPRPMAKSTEGRAISRF